MSGVEQSLAAERVKNYNLQNTIDELNKEKNANYRDANSDRSILIDLKTCEQNLKSLQQQKIHCDQLTDQNAILRTTIEKLNQVNSDNVDVIKTRLAQLEQRNASIEEQSKIIDKLNATNISITTENNNLKKTIENQQAKINQLNDDKNKIMKLVEDAGSGLKAELKTCNNKNEKLKIVLSKLRNTETELRNNISGNENSNNAVIKARSEERAKILAMIRVLKSELNECKSDMLAYKSDQDLVQKSLNFNPSQDRSQ
jgi:chromosome segregation ATPase